MAKKAKTLIEICSGPNCGKAGYDKIKEKIKELIGVGIGKHNNRYVIREVGCSGNCSGNGREPPVLRRDGLIYTGSSLMNNLEKIILYGDASLSSLNSGIRIREQLKTNEAYKKIGIGIDIGTTTLNVQLMSLEDGKSLSRVSTLNPQVAYGPTVIEREKYSKQNLYDEIEGLTLLNNSIVDTVNSLINYAVENYNKENKKRIHKRYIKKAVVAGNTIMTYFFLNKHSCVFDKIKPDYRKAICCAAKDLKLDINKNATVYCMPCIGEFVGGDIVSGISTTPLPIFDRNYLFMDLGTNGEIVVASKKDKVMLACAASAGPAFEGGGFRYGMLAGNGAIEGLEINNNYDTIPKVIGNEKPRGLCGSGILELLEQMLIKRIIDKSGCINISLNTNRIKKGTNPEYVIIPKDETQIGKDITISQSEIKYFINSKAAIYGSVSSLVKQLNLSINDIDQVYIAGEFGHLNIKKCITIGLLPDLPLSKFEYLGNTSLKGTYLFLQNANMNANANAANAKLGDLVKKVTYVELKNDADFYNEYMAARFFPHTNLELFPSVEI